MLNESLEITQRTMLRPFIFCQLFKGLSCASHDLSLDPPVPADAVTDFAPGMLF